MNTTAQMSLNLPVPERPKRIWAFAKDKRRSSKGRKRKMIAAYKHCIITACSKEAKALGIRVGMRYEEAKRLLPDLKVLVIGDRRV